MADDDEYVEPPTEALWRDQPVSRWPDPRDAQQPQTPTGKRLGFSITTEDIRDVEAEAIAIGAKAERERLRAKAMDRHDSNPSAGHWGTPWSCVRCSATMGLLAEPEAGS